MSRKTPLNASMSRRGMLKLMGGAAAVTALAACAAPPSASTEGGDEPMQVAGTLTVVHRREYFKEMEDLFSQAVLDWGAENNIEMEVSTVAAEAFEDFVAKLVAQVEAGNPPDLVYHRSNLVSQMHFLDALESVDDGVASAVEMYGAPAANQVANNKIGDNWWGIPYIMSGGGRFARRSLLEAAGVDPLAISTFDELRDGLLAASNPAEEQYGWGMTVNRSGDGAGLVSAVFHNWGGTITDAEMTELTFNSPETVAAMEWLTEIYTSDEYADMLPPGIVSWTDSSNNEAYIAGNIIATQNAASVYAKAKDDGSPFFEDTVVLNTLTGPANIKLEGGGGAQFNVPRGAASPDLATDLSLHLLDPEVFLPISLISAGLFLPAYENYYGMDEVVAAFEADPNLARMGEQTLGDYPGLSYPAEPNAFIDAIDAQAIMTDILAQTITAGVSPADAVAQGADRMAQIADEMQAFA